MQKEKRKRRTLAEIHEIRDQLLSIVERHERLTLSQIVSSFGKVVGVKNTPSDKNLVKKQLDRLAKDGQINFIKTGRDLVATKRGDRPGSGEAQLIQTEEGIQLTQGDRVLAPNLAAIRAYAQQLDEFARTLQGQIRTLIRMIERATE